MAGKKRRRLCHVTAIFPPVEKRKFSGLKEIGYDTLMRTNSALAFEKAVKGMLPKTSLGRKQITRLKVYKDDKYVETAQMPKAVAVKGV